MADKSALSERDYGYDPTVDEPIEVESPARPLTLPSAAEVNMDYLPPVGEQHTPNCAAWASTYGLATFHAAQAGQYAPNRPGLQASSAYIYIQVMKQDGVNGSCQGSQLTSYFNSLVAGGTPTMEQAPYEPNCAVLWEQYGSDPITPDAAFRIGGFSAVGTKTLDDVKSIIASNRPLAYGTSLYTDFASYKGEPVPYVGNGTIKRKGDGNPVGHCMMIVAYDDNVGPGAFYIQNSFGTAWGTNGFIWMAYDTFTQLAQGKAFYIKE
jgi:hypothetical protein